MSAAAAAAAAPSWRASRCADPARGGLRRPPRAASPCLLRDAKATLERQTGEQPGPAGRSGSHVRRLREEEVLWAPGRPGLRSARPAPVWTDVRGHRESASAAPKPQRPPPEGRGAFKPKGLSHELAPRPSPRAPHRSTRPTTVGM